MPGDDVYDNARWCRICQTSEHSDCEPFTDFDFNCVACGVVITDSEYEIDGVGFCAAHRPARGQGDVQP